MSEPIPETPATPDTAATPETAAAPAGAASAAAPAPASASGPAPGRWTLDEGSSAIGFQHKTFWGLANVRGTFSGLHGDGEIGADGTAHGTVQVDAASLDTKHAKRDTHLRSADFFDAGQHPQITYTATSVTRGADGTVQVAGDLAVRGTSRPVNFTATTPELTADAVTLAAEVVVDRAWYGMTWNQLGMLRGAATLSLTLRFTHTG